MTLPAGGSAKELYEKEEDKMIQFIFVPIFGGLGTFFPILRLKDEERGTRDEV